MGAKKKAGINSEPCRSDGAPTELGCVAGRIIIDMALRWSFGSGCS